MSGNFLLIYMCNFHVLSNLLFIYICKFHWNLIGDEIGKTAVIKTNQDPQWQDEFFTIKLPEEETLLELRYELGLTLPRNCHNLTRICTPGIKLGLVLTRNCPNLTRIFTPGCESC